jgi:hypothetical protein
MKGAALGTIGKAISQRLRGDRPGPFRAFVVAAIIGIITAVITYRLLRSGE